MSVTLISNSSSPAENDIVKQGYLYIKRPPQNGFLRFKSWHKRYFVLRDETMDHPSRLEMYQKDSDFFKNSSGKFVLYLDNVIHVGRTGDSKRFPQAFMIVCSGRAPIMLAEDDPLYANSWLLAVTLIGEKGKHNVDGMDTIMRHCHRSSSVPATEYRRSPSGEFHDFLEEVPLNVCYSESLLEEITVKKYDVTIEATKTSRRNNIEGDYQLVVRSWGLSLVRPGKEDYIVHWPLCFIRKFKSEFLPHSSKKKSTLVTLELGRRCMTGEGVLQFRTRHGKEIVADMNQAICHSMSSKLMMDTMAKGRSLFRTRSSNHGAFVNSSLPSGTLRSSVSREPSSSRGSSFSRKSTRGNAPRSMSGPSGDGCLHVVDLSTILHSTSSGNIMSGNGGGSLQHQRSPLRSDSSGDSKTMGDVPTARTSISSLVSTSSTSSSHSASSSESAEYIQAEFSSPDRSRLYCSASSPRPSNGVPKIFPCNSFPPHMRQDSTVVEDIAEIDKERLAKAEAEGYLEVLPDLAVCEDTPFDDGDDLSSIYHVMDFSKRSRSTSPTHSKSSSTVTSSSRRDSGERKRHHHSCRILPSDLVFGNNLSLDKNSVVRRSNCGLTPCGKPPAPLPRPEHTMS